MHNIPIPHLAKHAPIRFTNHLADDGPLLEVLVLHHVAQFGDDAVLSEGRFSGFSHAFKVDDAVLCEEGGEGEEFGVGGVGAEGFELVVEGVEAGFEDAGGEHCGFFFFPFLLTNIV